MSTTVSGSSPTSPVFAYGDSRYVVVPGSWTEAESAAMLLGGHLVTINSLEEDNALTQIMGSAAFLANYPDIGYGFEYTYTEPTYPGFSLRSTTKTVQLGPAYWIGLTSNPPHISPYVTYPQIESWSSGEVSTYRGQRSPHNQLSIGTGFPVPAVVPNPIPAFFMKIGAGAGDYGKWAVTNYYQFNFYSVNPYRASFGLAEITLADALNIQGSEFADVLISESESSELIGVAGTDLLMGSAGNDTLNGDDGDDDQQLDESECRWGARGAEGGCHESDSRKSKDDPPVS